MITAILLVAVALLLVAARDALLPPDRPAPHPPSWSDEILIASVETFEAEYRVISTDWGATWSTPYRLPWPWLVQDHELPWTP